MQKVCFSDTLKLGWYTSSVMEETYMGWSLPWLRTQLPHSWVKLVLKRNYNGFVKIPHQWLAEREGVKSMSESWAGICVLEDARNLQHELLNWFLLPLGVEEEKAGAIFHRKNYLMRDNLGFPAPTSSTLMPIRLIGFFISPMLER